MAGFPRKKRVTDLFDDDARARLVAADNRKLSSVATGSVYPGDGDSLSLSGLVHGFLEEDSSGGDDDAVANELDSGRVDSFDDLVDSAEGSLGWRSVSVALGNNADPYRNALLEHVSEAAEKFSFLRERNVSIFRRSVAAFLREKGHDAAVCVTTWDSSSAGGGVTAGSHEFIDVSRSGSSTWRYFVELDFRQQFEIARPTRQFSEVLSSVPGVFVGGATALKRTVSIVCDAAKRCFRSRGLPVPPWRKNRFMQNKWFAPCRGTANPVQGNPLRVTAVNGVSCRLVGFDDVVTETRHGGGVFVRTR